MIGFATALAASAGMALAVPADAQDHSMHDMPGMTMRAPAKKVPARRPAAKRPVRKAATTPAKRTSKKAAPAKRKADGTMPGMTMSSEAPGQAEIGHAGLDMSEGTTDKDAMSGMAMTGTALPAGDAPAPPLPTDHYADRYFPASEMARARRAMMREDGGQTFSQIMVNLAEVQIRGGRDGYRWDGEGWFGGDIDRLTVKTEGEGVFGRGARSAEIQALYSRAIGPYFNLQAGIRHDFQPSSARTYATVGFEGLAPYWFDVEGALFLSDKGDVLGRLEGYYDQRITQRLILQPRVELNLSTQDVPENRVGAGLSDAELGLRLRYEFSRQFAPYIGVSYEAKTGRTADFARIDGDDPTTTSLVAGLRFWF